MSKGMNRSSLRCSFCGSKRDDVQVLITNENDSAYICNDCVDVCIGIIEENGFSARTSNRPNEIDYEKLGIKPRFNKLRFTPRDNHCFYLCPFSEPFNTVYNDHIIKAVTSNGFTVERADEIFGTQPIIEDIWEAINSASLVIADVTGKNPNVMYETGMAHTIGKPVLIITQNIDDVPFDLKHYRCIIYEYTPRGCAKLEEKVTSTVRFLKGKLF
jgi:hypothetical protein